MPALNFNEPRHSHQGGQGGKATGWLNQTEAPAFSYTPAGCSAFPVFSRLKWPEWPQANYARNSTYFPHSPTICEFIKVLSM